MIDSRLVERLERAMAQLVAALTEQTAALRVPVQVTPYVVHAKGVDRPQELIPANRDRLKLMVAYLSAAGGAFLATKPEAAADFGFPINASRPPFLDDWPHVHKGQWWIQFDTADTAVAVIEWTAIPA